MAKKSRRRVNASEKLLERLPAQAPFQQPRLTVPPVAFVSADELEAIHLVSLEILENIGIQCTSLSALRIFKDAGAEVNWDTQMVRLARGLIESRIHTAPSSFVLQARNRAHNVRFGDNYIAFGSVGSTPNSFDLEGGRRPGNVRDFRDFIRLSQIFNITHFIGGYPVEPVDVPVPVRHLQCSYDLLTLSDKGIHVYSLARQRNIDAIEMTRIAHAVSEEDLDKQALIFTIINSNSPMKLDTPMMDGIIEMSSRNQAVVFTPFTLAGAMAPVTLAGALAQQNAEALVGLLFTQLVRPGAPFIYGGFTSNVDMKSGAPAFGTPEYMKACMVGGQLARRYNVPYRSSNVCAANSLDAQAAYESVFSLWGCIMGGAHFIHHGLGWMEGGLQASFEKFVMDADLVQMVAEFLKPISTERAEFGLEAIRAATPGGHFFGAKHTLERYRSAFYAPLLSDWRNYETWQEAGSPTVPEKAHRLYKAFLASYTPPPMEAAVREELAAFVAKRTEEGGVPNP